MDQKMDLRSGPPPPPRGRVPPELYTELHMESHAGAGFHVPRRLGERNLDRNHREVDTSPYTEDAPRNILADTPETIVGENVHVKGELSFERLLRVDGSFKGKLTSTGDLVIGANGVIRGNIIGVREIVSDGTIVGNIEAERLRLRRSALVIGDVTCHSLSVDPDVSIRGKLNVHKDAPDKLYLEGEDSPEEEVASSRDNKSRETGIEKKSKEGKESVAKSSGGSSKKDGNTKKENGSSDNSRDRREKEDRGKEDSHRKKSKDGGSGDSSKSKTTTK